MLKRYEIIDGKIQDSRDDKSSVLVFIDPDESEKRYLIEEMKLDEHTLQSSADPDELSRVEFEPEHIALIFKRPKNYSSKEQFVFKVSSMGMFMFRERLIIVLPEEQPLFEGKQFLKVATLQDLVLKIINITILHYLGHLKTINMVSESLEKKIHTAMENRYLINLFTLEKGIVYYYNSIHSNGVVIDKLRNSASKIGFTPENLEYLDDISIENNQCYKQAEIFSNIFASMMDARVSIVNNNLNILMKTLNIITISIMVPTFVVSAFSMNVKIPFSQYPLAFWIVLGLGGVALTLFMLIWRKLSRK